MTEHQAVRQGGSYRKDPKTGKTTLITRTGPRPDHQAAPTAPKTQPTPTTHEVSDGTV